MDRVRRAVACLVMVSVVLVAAGHARAADDNWQEPKDGLFTEKQVERYAAAQKEIIQLMKAMGKAVEGSKTGFGAAAVLAGADEKVSAILATHDLKRAEYDWLGTKIFQCLGIAMIDEQMDAGKQDMAEQKKRRVAELEAAKQKVAAYEKALKEGKRVLSKEQREELAKQAKSDQDSALEEAKQHAQEAKEAADEAAKMEADAKAAEALAKNPPSDVDQDGRADFIKGKQEEAANLRANAKEARDREKEAKKAEADSKSKAAAYARQMTTPDVPATDEEKAQVKTENEQGLASAKTEVETLTQANGLLADSDVQGKKMREEMHKDIKEENLVIVKKHMKELKEGLGIEEKK